MVGVGCWVVVQRRKKREWRGGGLLAFFEGEKKREREGRLLVEALGRRAVLERRKVRRLCW